MRSVRLFAWAAVVGALGAAAAPARADVFISEIHYDNASTDQGEFVEVTGDAGTDLSGWSIVLYNGSNGTSYGAIDLGGTTLNDQGGGLGAASFPRSGIQNGAPDGLALVDPTATVVEFLSYEGELTAADGPAAGQSSVDIGVAESSSTGIGQSLQRVDGEWTGPAAQSPGALNGASEAVVAFIHEVQGSGASSPMAGLNVTVEGIVVGAFEEISSASPSDAPLGGFFLQEEDADADGDPATSEGLFVFTNASGDSGLQLGDRVRVTGTVEEFFGMTEISFPSDVTVIATDETLPTPAMPILPTAPGDAAVNWEAIEGMSVVFGQTLFVTGLFPQGSFGEVQLSAIGPQNHPNQVHSVGSPAALAQRQLNLASRVLLDDGESENESFPSGLSTWNPTPTPYLLPPEGTLRSGDAVAGLSGVVLFSFGEYEVHPVNGLDPLEPDAAVALARVEPRPDVPDVGGSLRVASFNVLNYFTTLDSGSNLCGPPSFEQGCRGADTAAEFELQAAKIVDAIVELDADILGLIEIENDAGPAVADLVSRLNGEPDATRTYASIDTDYIGTDAIAVALIYDVATVAPAGAFAVLDSAVSPAFIDTLNRPALAQTFTEIASGETLTIAVNHLKSKGSACDTVANPGDPAFGVDPYPAGADVDDPNLQGNCNLARTAAARVLGQWLASDPTGTPSSNLLILGDLNAYANEDPITELESQGYTDRVEQQAGGNRWELGAHSYVFDGEFGTLDYALANPALGSRVTGAAVWHVNADEPFAIDYQDFNPPGQSQPDAFKASDHDPILVGVQLAPLCGGLVPTITGSGLILGTGGADVILGSDGTDFILGLAGADMICAGAGNDRVIGGPGADVLFGEAGRDRLLGGRADDVLDGGDGVDIGLGGLGSDTCVDVERARSCSRP